MTPDLTLSQLVAKGVLALSDGYRTRSDQLGDDGLPILRVADVLNGSLAPSLTDFIREEYRPKMGPKISRADDVLVTTKGTVGRVARVPHGFQQHAYSPQVCFLRSLNTHELDPGWLYQWARSPEFLNQLGIFKDQTDMAPYVSLTDLRRVRISIPRLDEQRRIARVLGALDDLIESELHQARLTNDLWRAKISSAILPEAESVPLSSLASFVNGKNFTKDASGLGLPVIRTPEVRSGPTTSTVRSDVAASRANIAFQGDLLFVWSGSLMASRWKWERGLVNQHVFKVTPYEGVPGWLVMFAIEELMQQFLDIAADKATTMGHIKRGDLDRAVAVPRRGAWEALDVVIQPLWEEALASEVQAVALAGTRDELLPLLMSGRVRVEDVRGAA
jgi:type I restriction enzyme S subunit